jgi:excinuclease ABC subunit B
VAILDADKEGFLRSDRSLIQTCGRAARNVNGTVLLYADRITGSMNRAMEESSRRREIQLAFNMANHITPTSIRKNIRDVLASVYEADYVSLPQAAEDGAPYLTPDEIEERIKALMSRMKEAAGRLDFEMAARLRDEIRALEKREVEWS